MRSTKERIDEIFPEIRALSHEIHENPELGYEEKLAVKLHTDILKKYGFEVENPACGLETGFIASYKNKEGKKGPTLGFLAEYDALPGLGHACGHNMVGALATMVGIAMREAVDENGGEVRVIGAPAEETSGGKVIFAREGVYDSLDAAMMAHPFGIFAASGTFYGLQPLRFEFFGKAAHAAGAPESGINALDGVLATFAGINALRQHVPTSVRIHGIVRDGGKAPNIVPDYACADFYVRADEIGLLREVTEKVKHCAEGGALSSGARLEISEFELPFLPFKPNYTLSELYIGELRKTDEALREREILPYNTGGSSDVGDVSQHCPAIHEWIDIAGDPKVEPHTPEFCVAADSDYAYESLHKVAEAFVNTAERLQTEPELLEAIQKEFRGE